MLWVINNLWFSPNPAKSNYRFLPKTSVLEALSMLSVKAHSCLRWLSHYAVALQLYGDLNYVVMYTLLEDLSECTGQLVFVSTLYVLDCFLNSFMTLWPQSTFTVQATFTHSHTQTHTALYSLVTYQWIHQGQFGVQSFAQGHLDMQTGGALDQTTEPLYFLSHSCHILLCMSVLFLFFRVFQFLSTVQRCPCLIGVSILAVGVDVS